MNDLNELRNQIDNVDKDIVYLLEKRMNIVKEVAKYKIANDKNVLDEEREKNVIYKNLKRVENDDFKIYIESILKNIMCESKNMQKKIINDTSLYGLIGEKLGHSFSKNIHNYIFNKLDICGKYSLLEVKSEDLKSCILKLKENNFKGLNVTIPYKVDIINFLDDLSFEAKKIGAVNTIKFDDNKSIGYNTDYFGFKKSLEKNNIDVNGKDCVILGSGGAARMIYNCFCDCGANNIYVVTRNKNKYDLNKHFKNSKIIDYNELENLRNKFILVNATPCGMYPNIKNCVVKKSVFKNYKVAFDIIYNPIQTLFLKYAREFNLKTINGMYMLSAQAVKSEEIWNDIKIDDKVIDDICISLQNKNIFLIGMPGCGKTSLGKILSKRLNLKFYDLDECIEKFSGKSINDIFKNGEEYFRSLETNVLKQIKNNRCVISTGGGIIEKEENIKFMHKNGIIIFIDRAVDKIMINIDVSSRPLLKENKQNLINLYNKRYDLYLNNCDLRVENNSSINEVVNKIESEVKNHC